MTRALIMAAAQRLAAAGIDTPRVDADLMAAHVLGIDRGRLVAADAMTDTQRDVFVELVSRRERREPLQHITGTAPFGPIELAVGPGVFIPRPETELMMAWAVRACADIDRPAVVDLCSGSGALAIAIATLVPDAHVIAVENDPDALIWLRRNVTAAGAGDRVSVVASDARDPATLEGARADLVVSNPPYVPTGVRLDPEVAEHDPEVAVFAGADGMSVITPMLALIARILVPGGSCAIEHDDATADLVVGELTRSGDFDAVAGELDLAGRPRFVHARRTTERSPTNVRGCSA